LAAASWLDHTVECNFDDQCQGNWEQGDSSFDVCVTTDERSSLQHGEVRTARRRARIRHDLNRGDVKGATVEREHVCYSRFGKRTLVDDMQ
jgi:hypothetical protein